MVEGIQFRTCVSTTTQKGKHGDCYIYMSWSLMKLGLTTTGSWVKKVQPPMPSAAYKAYGIWHMAYGMRVAPVAPAACHARRQACTQRAFY